MKHIRIGIPRALLYHSHAASWGFFFRELGCEVIFSPETHAGILRDGIRRSVSDLCLPVKIFLGHVESLKDSVDYLFIPRYISIEDDAYMCPKLIGLPDMVRACFANLPGILPPQYHRKRDGVRAAAAFAKEVARMLSLDMQKAEKIFLRSAETAGNGLEQHTFGLSAPAAGTSAEDAGSSLMSVGIIGRPYLVLDQHTGKGLFRTLRELRVRPVFLSPPADEVREAMTIIPKWVYWSMGKEVVTSAHVFFKDDSIDGVINICSATCGPDSFTNDLIRKRLNQRRKPYMSLSLDEHTSDVGIRTRVEAFVDMLRKVTA